LLDMSRLQAGALKVACRPTSLEEVVPAALASLGDGAGLVAVNVPETLPQVEADPALLERVIANLVANAVTHSKDSQPVRVEADTWLGKVEVRVIDQGPGIPLDARERVFQPFQRLGDSDRDRGVGLGLAVARGFTDAMGAALTVDDTPGGGTTMVVELKAVA
jgi:two-component system sensor histidine kinase KdpD